MPDPIRLMIADVTSGKYPEHVKNYSQGMPFDLIYPEEGNEESMKAAAREAEAILSFKTELSGEVIKSAPSLKFIQKHGLNLKTSTWPPRARLEHRLRLCLSC